ncbi:hypothetical protein PPMP20_12150 [Paraburkholderia phymatum]|uniref:Uncharacterized protein n=2 Tax=Paraburkholderia phymatum TaxID=148447 RepID=B2JFS2_PARP8|nr:hypothetical protein [Paraburkholderia phymatum]ACC71547.1 hypothetical protein Bphy_2372 [Paraburkholderia phymatum STM815]
MFNANRGRPLVAAGGFLDSAKNSLATLPAQIVNNAVFYLLKRVATILLVLETLKMSDALGYLHEIWLCPDEHGRSLPACIPFGPDGDGAHSLNEPGSEWVGTLASRGKVC